MAILGHFQHVGNQKACSRADELNGDTLTHSHTLLHAFSGNFHAIWVILDKFNMLVIKRHVLELRNSIMILSQTVIHCSTHFRAIYMQFSHYLPEFVKIVCKLCEGMRECLKVSPLTSSA